MKFNPGIVEARVIMRGNITDVPSALAVVKVVRNIRLDLKPVILRIFDK